MTKPKPNPQPKLSYYSLLEDLDVKRWYDNVAGGSLATAAVWLRRMGFIHKNFRRTPQDLGKDEFERGCELTRLTRDFQRMSSRT